MTGRTHDLAAFTALTYVVATQPIAQISLATGLCALIGNMVGALMPDIDQPTAELWNKVPAGSIIGRMITPFLGEHRYISHSILGTVLFGFLVWHVLHLASSVVLVDMDIVWWSFMIGYISHLVMDTITREGVPWLFPLPVRFGMPPFKALRLKTGGFLEKGFVFPLLLIAIVAIVYFHYGQLLTFIKNFF